MPDPADMTADAGSAGQTTVARRREGRAGRRRAMRERLRATSDEASGWAVALFWGSTAFAAFALGLLVASFLL
jgi:hypothetical protein